MLDELLVIRQSAPTHEASSEWSYLASLVDLQIRRAAPRAIFLEPGQRPEASDRRARLILGEEPLLVTERTVRRGLDSLGAGAGVFLPHPITHFPARLEAFPPHTLRDFETFEAELGAASDEPRWQRSSHLPLALVGPACDGAVDPFDPAALASWESELGSGAVVRDGLYYPFVDYYGQRREDILPFVPEGAREVLDVGCGRGKTGAWLKERLGCRVTGVELHPGIAAEAAQRLDRVLVGDIESLDLGRDRYDVVVATELVEHLRYPEPVLRRLGEATRPGGRVLLSIPNVGHHSVVGDLLAGRWDYLPIGLLCYTHFRFFTRRTLGDWLERIGFSSFEILPQRTEAAPWVERLPAGLEFDAESLRTSGFYVLIEVSPDSS